MKMARYLVILCTYIFVLYNYVHCDVTPAKVKINLDLPPEKRWVDACLKHEQRFRQLVEFAERAIIPKPLIGIVNKIGEHFDKYIPTDIYGEMKGIADTLKIDIGVFALFNILYDVTAFQHNFLTNQYSGCTSIVAQDPKGTIWLARNLDYGQIGDLTEILRNMTIEVEYVRGGKVAFTSTTYAGVVGVVTAQKPHEFALTINERDEGSILQNAYVLLAKNYTFTTILARQVAENASNFDDAVKRLSDAITPAPSYFTVSGAKPGQGAVITRDRLDARDVWRLNPKNGTWFLVETNYDHWTPTPSTDNRREVAIKAMEHVGQKNVNSDELFKVLSIYPVLNGGTTYTTIMNAAKPDAYRSVVRDYTL